MERLSGTDALFLSLEQPNWHQHVGGLTIMDRTDAPEFDFLTMRQNLVERLPLAPKFSWKLKEVPFNLDRPVWVDDEAFDVDQHLHHVALPEPGGLEQLAELTGKILSRQLDRRRPLWELWFIEGLPNNRVAMVMKFHHCLLDGVAGSSLASLLLDFEPDAEPPEIPPEDEVDRAGSAPSDAELLARSAVPVMATPMRAARYAVRAARRGVTMATMARRGTGLMPTNVPTTTFNGPVGAKRRLAFCSLALDDVKAVKNHFDVKLNDVVLAVCAGALRNYLQQRDALPDRPLISGVPISTRDDEGPAGGGNQLANMVVSLATDVDDPAERLRAIYESSQGAKEMTAAVRAIEIPSMGETAPPVMFNVSLGAMAGLGLASLVPTVMNTLISNVQGPPFPLYCCRARVTGIYSTSVIVEGMGLNITLFSYMDRLDFGLHVDPDLVTDPWAIADGFTAALAELMDAARLGSPTVVENPLG
ncbi:MAG: wax ester/triacylglycerol synthase family O-acyltransferase, partial [Acidimicrobiia bacterium]|nr:wax ester/triacylglycerol synthase family O-acyltransferase [Acidimicrobiia bacterium]